jgi:putative N6-adenine-specific DNA methylase
MSVDQTFSVTARVWDSQITHSQYAALRIKDAVCDVFRGRSGRRPSVDTARPQFPLFLSLYRDRATLYRDFAGSPLSRRGYRRRLHRASLNEAVAAGIIGLTNWDRQETLADPMCGSATLLIEAAAIALDRAPGLSRTEQAACESWLDFVPELWRQQVAAAREHAKTGFSAAILGCDHHAGAIQLARDDIARAGFSQHIELTCGPLEKWRPRLRPRVVVCNPPWGDRLAAGVEQSWRGLRLFLKQECAPSTAWLLSGAPENTQFLGLKATARLPLQVGPVDARLLRYDILPPLGEPASRPTPPA